MIHKILNNFFLKIWYSKSLFYTFISFIFLPLSIIYYIVFNIKYCFQKQHHFNIPIICIGNLVVGGSGKTSVALSIIEMLPEKKIVVLLMVQLMLKTQTTKNITSAFSSFWF